MKKPIPKILTCTLLVSALSLWQPDALFNAYAQGFMEQGSEHMDAAKSYMATEQWNYANYEWRAALMENPQNTEAHVGLVEALLRSGNAQDAARHLSEIRRTMDKLSIELAYGKTLETMGKPLEAERVYLRILERVPLESNTFNRLISLLAYLPASKQKSLKAFLERRAQQAAAQGRLALKQQKFDEAIENFAISTRYDPNIRDLNDYGVALLLLGHYDEAHQQFDQLKQTESRQWEIYANTALVALGKGRSSEAATQVERAISLCQDASKKPLLYNLLGFVYENQGRWPNARNAYERAIELHPGFTKAKMNLAYVYQKDRAYGQAIAAYREMLRAEPRNATLWNRLGFVYELANKERLALDAYKKAAEADPYQEEGYFNQAMLYRKLGRTKAADLAYKKVMNLEFAVLEAGKTGSQKSPSPEAVSNAATPVKQSDQTRDPKLKLLDYVDVFFSQAS